MEMQFWTCSPVLLCIATQGLLRDVGPSRSTQLLVHTSLVYPAYTIKLLHVMSTHQTDLEISSEHTALKPGLQCRDGVYVLDTNWNRTRCATIAMQNIMSLAFLAILVHPHKQPRQVCGDLHQLVQVRGWMQHHVIAQP